VTKLPGLIPDAPEATSVEEKEARPLESLGVEEFPFDHFSDTYKVVDIWLGKWPDEASFSSYVAELHEREYDQPLSPFAAGQRQIWYDHDFFESYYFDRPVTLETAMGECLGYTSFAEPLAASFKRKRSKMNFNVAILAYGLIIRHPRSVKKSAGFELCYLGRFSSHEDRLQPSCPPPEAPARILLESDERTIHIDERGVVLGTGGTQRDERPYFDLGLRELGAEQAEIYPGPQGFWVLEDKAANGLTVYQGLKLNGSKQFPVQGDVVDLGRAKFRWTDLL
jgi:hypothetical protein